MKPLSVKEQIKVLEELLRTWDIIAMCPRLYVILKKNHGMQLREHVSDYIPSFTRSNYLKFHIKTKAVRKRVESLYWDSHTTFGNFRRRWFIRHLIKELEK